MKKVKIAKRKADNADYESSAKKIEPAFSMSASHGGFGERANSASGKKEFRGANGLTAT